MQDDFKGVDSYIKYFQQFVSFVGWILQQFPHII